MAANMTARGGRASLHMPALDAKLSVARTTEHPGSTEVESRRRWLTTTGAGQAPVTFGGS